jgi:hypothetical protein
LSSSLGKGNLPSLLLLDQASPFPMAVASQPSWSDPWNIPVKEWFGTTVELGYNVMKGTE